MLFRSGSPGGNGRTHNNVIYQVFHVPAPGKSYDYKVGEITIPANNQKCINIPKIGEYYFRQVFYCDTQQITCEETRAYYTVGCDDTKCDSGEVLRKRTLKNVISGGCNGWQSETCISDDGTGFDCSVQADKTDTGSAGNDGTSISDDDIIFNNNAGLNGEWQNIGIPPIADAGKTYEINARFEAFVDGKYYLEAGAVKSPLAFVTADQSLCDGSKEFAGVVVDLKSGESVDVRFTPTASSETGNYQVVLGAYTGCLSNGGHKITSLTKGMKVVADGATSTNGSIAGFIAAIGGTGMLIGIGVVILLIVVGLIILMLKSK